VLADHASRRRYDHSLVVQGSNDGLLLSSPCLPAASSDSCRGTKTHQAEVLGGGLGATRARGKRRARCPKHAGTDGVTTSANGARESYSATKEGSPRQRARAREDFAADMPSKDSGAPSRAERDATGQDVPQEAAPSEPVQEFDVGGVLMATHEFDAAEFVRRLLATCPSSWPVLLADLADAPLHAVRQQVAQRRAPKRSGQESSAMSGSGALGVVFSVAEVASSSSPTNVVQQSELAWRSGGAGSIEEHMHPNAAAEHSDSDFETTFLMLCDGDTETHPDLFDSQHLGEPSTGACKVGVNAYASIPRDQFRTRGICKHSTTHRYFALVGFQCLQVRSQYSNELDDAIGYHVSLTIIKSAVKRDIFGNRLVPFDHAVRAAVASVLEGSDSATGSGLRLCFGVMVWCATSRRQFCSPSSQDLDEVLRARQRLLEARSSGPQELSAAHAAIWAAILEAKAQRRRSMAAAEEERREKKRRRLEEANAAKAATKAANMASRALRHARVEERRRREHLMMQLRQALRAELARRSEARKQTLAEDQQKQRHATAQRRQIAREEAASRRRERLVTKRFENMLRQIGRTTLPEYLRFNSDDGDGIFYAAIECALEGATVEEPRLVLEGPPRETALEAEADSRQLRSALDRGGREAALGVLEDLEITHFARLNGGAQPWDDKAS